MRRAAVRALTSVSLLIGLSVVTLTWRALVESDGGRLSGAGAPLVSPVGGGRTLLGDEGDCAAALQKRFGCGDSGCWDKVSGYINFLYTHECVLGGAPAVSYIGQALLLMYFLYMLGDTADDYFCPSLQIMVQVLHISPNIAGVTFLSFGNGAPDVFASLAAFVGGSGTVAVGAIVGAGIFVTTVVVGAVSLVSYARIHRRPFLRDTVFYIIALSYLVLVYRDRKVTILEAFGFLAIYAVFVLVVVIGRSVYQRWKREAAGMAAAVAKTTPGTRARLLNHDSLRPRSRSAETLVAMSKRSAHLKTTVADAGRSSSYTDLAPKERERATARPPALFRAHRNWAHNLVSGFESDEEVELEDVGWTEGRHKHKLKWVASADDNESGSVNDDSDDEELGCIAHLAGKDAFIVCAIDWILLPSGILRRATVPLLEDDTYDWRYTMSSAFLGTVGFVFVAAPTMMGPLPWYGLALPLGVLATAWTYFFVPKDKIPTGIVHTVVLMFSFLMSVTWIMVIANEVVDVVVSLGLLLSIPNAVIGMTVVAWGNSLGDFVADTTVAREGYPTMAIAGTFAGPLFNLVVGFGLSLSYATIVGQQGSHVYEFPPDDSITEISFVALMISLVGSLLIIPASGFVIRRWYGVVLIVLYCAFLAVEFVVRYS